ncbi:hypothetical protein D9M69_491250 [compost metagenome]
MLLHAAQLRSIHFGYHPLPAPNFNELARFWNVAVAAVFRCCGHSLLLNTVTIYLMVTDERKAVAQRVLAAQSTNSYRYR